MSACCGLWRSYNCTYMLGWGGGSSYPESPPARRYGLIVADRHLVVRLRLCVLCVCVCAPQQLADVDEEEEVANRERASVDSALKVCVALPPLCLPAKM